MQPGPILGPQSKGGVLDRFQYLFLTMGILIFSTLGWRGRLPVMLVGGDELTYVSLSRSLEAGSYREIHSASAPRHVKYPPGYPAWLLAVRKVGGESHDLVRALNLAFIAVAIFGTCLIVRKVAGAGPALAACFLLVFNPSLLGVGATLLSEAPYIGLTGAALAVSALALPSSWRPALVAVLLAMAAFLTRAAGLTIVLAIGLWLLQRRRRRELLAYGVACLVVVGGWFAYTRSVPHPEAGQSYRTDLVGSDFRGRPDAPSRVELTFQNTVWYATSGLPSALALPTVPGTWVDNAFWLAAMAVLVGAGILRLSRASPAVGWYLLLSGALLVAWPWRQDRLLLPIVPFVIAAMLIGAHYLARSLPSRARTVILGSLTVLMGVGAIRGALARDAAAATCDRSRPHESPGCYDDQSRSLAAAAQYLRSTAPAKAIVLTVSGAAVKYLSGLSSEPAEIVRDFAPGEAGQRLRERGVRYILITGRRRVEKRWFGPILLASCHDLRLDARFPPEGFVLTTEPPLSPSEDACGPLARLVKSPGESPEQE